MTEQKLCPCFPGMCRGGEVINGFTVVGEQCQLEAGKRTTPLPKRYKPRIGFVVKDAVSGEIVGSGVAFAHLEELQEKYAPKHVVEMVDAEYLTKPSTMQQINNLMARVRINESYFDPLFPSLKEMRDARDQKLARAPFEVLAFNPSTAHIDHSGATVPTPIPCGEVVTTRVTFDEMKKAAYEHKERFGFAATRDLMDKFGVKKLRDIERDDEMINRVAAAVHFDMLFKALPEQPSVPVIKKV